MASRKGSAEWKGNLANGQGTLSVGDGRFEGIYTAESRFGDGKETNPEELIATAHAACFSMALSHVLAEEGFNPVSVKTEATVSLEKSGDGFAVTTIELETEAEVPGIDDATFQQHAETAVLNCPVSKALSSCDIRLSAHLVYKP
jgi:lipoyl-dependent peroxiredoxin